MLTIKNLKKEYKLNNSCYEVLKGINLQFRESEFVCVLGPSGCGKTTLLNILGGLDHPTSGDIIIDGKNTNSFTSKDFDNYRNHRIGFVFQNYNLIMHQNILTNVAIALSLSGIAKNERIAKAIEALETVGLKEMALKKPNELSGGERQRVAIARAIVTEPDIILADEPTGALDTATSLEIMNLLKKIGQNRLVILVTHNPELATKYATRIIHLKDGIIVSDTDPCKILEEEQKVKTKSVKKTQMSFITALGLSFKNLIQKKTRTILSSIAGSLGIIGIALILSLSNGFSDYIDRNERQSYSDTPIEIKTYNNDVSSLSSAAYEYLLKLKGQKTIDDEHIESAETTKLANQLFSRMNHKNDLSAFKDYLESHIDYSKIIAVDYDYNVHHTAFAIKTDSSNKLLSYQNLEDPMGELLDKINAIDEKTAEVLDLAIWAASVRTFDQAYDNLDYLKTQYELVGKNSKWFDLVSPNEIMLVVDQNNKISDYSLYQLGLKDTNELLFDIILATIKREDFKQQAVIENVFGLSEDDLRLAKNYYTKLNSKNITEEEKEELYNKIGLMLLQTIFKINDYNPQDTKNEFTIDDLIGEEFVFIPSSSLYYENEQGGYSYLLNNEEELKKTLVDDSLVVRMKITGVVRPKIGTLDGSFHGSMIYTSATNLRLIDINNQSKIVQKQKNNTDFRILDNAPFGVDKNGEIPTYAKALENLGYTELSRPRQIDIYVYNEESRDYVFSLIDEYNSTKTDEESYITYSIDIPIILQYLKTILETVTIILVCITGISLIVSSLMIAIITHISVLERIKEIGILRSLGARKKDIARLFTAETFTIGLISGILGVVVTLVITPVINTIANQLVIGIGSIARLSALNILFLITISVLLTVTAGLIPSFKAAKKDPVKALSGGE